MLNEQISKFKAEIESLEKRLEPLPNELQEINQLIIKKNSEFEQLRKDQEKTADEVKKIGFFKFKEKKPFKEKIKELKGNIESYENEILDLQNKVSTITENEKTLKEKLQSVRQAKDKLQKELELVKKATQGDPQAQFEVANICFERKEKKEAMDWLKKSVDQGHADAKKLMLQIEEDKKRILAASYDITLW